MLHFQWPLRLPCCLFFLANASGVFAAVDEAPLHIFLYRSLVLSYKSSNPPPISPSAVPGVAAAAVADAVAVVGAAA